MISFLSRMSEEAQNIDNSIERMALGLFKEQKVAISQAIRESYPLLQLLRDHDFITTEMYDVSEVYFVTMWCTSPELSFALMSWNQTSEHNETPEKSPVSGDLLMCCCKCSYGVRREKRSMLPY